MVMSIPMPGHAANIDDHKNVDLLSKLIEDNDIVEIKCPHSIKDMKPKKGVLAKKIKFLTNDQDEYIKLKKKR